MISRTCATYRLCLIRIQYFYTVRLSLKSVPIQDQIHSDSPTPLLQIEGLHQLLLEASIGQDRGKRSSMEHPGQNILGECGIDTVYAHIGVPAACKAIYLVVIRLTRLV